MGRKQKRFPPSSPSSFVSQVFGCFADGSVLQTAQKSSFDLLGEVISHLRRERIKY